jgi:hypothetical protein
VQILLDPTGLKHCLASIQGGDAAIGEDQIGPITALGLCGLRVFIAQAPPTNAAPAASVRCRKARRVIPGAISAGEFVSRVLLITLPFIYTTPRTAHRSRLYPGFLRYTG